MDQVHFNKAQVIADQLGERIRRARRDQQLTLSELGQRTNLSPAFLSRLERGEATTSIGNLIVISSCLGITIPELFENRSETHPPADFTLSRARQREGSVALSAGEYSFYRLCGGLADPLLNAFELVFPVGSSKDLDLLTHEGQEILYILEGIIEFQIGASLFTMEVGDCLHLNAERPHMGRNIGSAPARALMVVSPWGAIEDRFASAKKKQNRPTGQAKTHKRTAAASRLTRWKRTKRRRKRSS